MLITLGISSSISAYKAAEILREFQKAGHDVRVTMTRSSTRFLRPFLFQTLSHHPVYLDEFKARKGEVQHIDLARETDLLVVAPASANVIGKFANGIADDFLSTFFLALRCPALVAPAMNVHMYRNPAVQKNLETLRARGIEIIEPEEGYLACGDEGPGRLAPVDQIVARALGMLPDQRSLAEKNVLITAGPTWEPIDPVRVLTSRSSGKMGYAMAEEAILRGAKVTLISGPTILPEPAGARVIHVQTASEMKSAVMKHFASADFVVKTAAVSDFRPAHVGSSKKKKTGEPETIVLEPTEDILRSLGEKKEHQILVGFCAETENLLENAASKLQKKNLDFIVANLVGEDYSPFQSDQNEVWVIHRQNNPCRIERKQKRLVASEIWNFILEHTEKNETESSGS